MFLFLAVMLYFCLIGNLYIGFDLINGFLDGEILHNEGNNDFMEFSELCKQNIIVQDFLMRKF